MRHLCTALLVCASACSHAPDEFAEPVGRTQRVPPPSQKPAQKPVETLRACRMREVDPSSDHSPPPQLNLLHDLDMRSRAIRGCYETLPNIEAHPAAITTRFTISTDGRIRQLQVDNPTNSPLEQCISRKMNGWRFPSLDGPLQVTATWDVEDCHPQ